MKIKRVSLFAIAILVLLGLSAFSLQRDIRWAMVNWKVRHDFPNVRRIDPEHVAVWLKDKNRPAPVLFDVRTKAEYDVSHIAGAKRVDPDAAAGTIQLPHDQPIVTYCSVGYRSGAFAKTLQDAGYTNVRNMSGSIFEWANEGRPIVHDGHPVEKVHPYNATWGKLLKPALRADVPSAGGNR
ncbi:MAG: rhodanese-like domain-containing protein [Chthoniobacterales bacterium]